MEQSLRNADSEAYRYTLLGHLSLKITIYFGMSVVSVEKALLVTKPMLYRTITVYHHKTFVYSTWILFIAGLCALFGSFSGLMSREKVGVKCVGKLVCRPCCKSHIISEARLEMTLLFFESYVFVVLESESLKSVVSGITVYIFRRANGRSSRCQRVRRSKAQKDCQVSPTPKLDPYKRDV